MRVTSTTASGRRRPASTRSTLRWSACAGSWAWSRRAGAALAFAVALTHDVDVPWKWTRTGVKGAAARAKSDLVNGRMHAGMRELRGLAGAAVHKATGTDPYWSFDRILEDERRCGASSTFFLLADHAHEYDGAAVESYERLRPRLVETLQDAEAEVGLHGSYSAADDAGRIAREKERLEELSGPVQGQRYHYLRVDPHRNLGALEAAGFAYDSSLGFGDAVGFRAGIAHPFRPWDFERDAPRGLVEVPLAAMDVTLSAERYLDLGVDEAEKRLDVAAGLGGASTGAALPSSGTRSSTTRPCCRAGTGSTVACMEGVRSRGGACLQAGALAEEARAWLS